MIQEGRVENTGDNEDQFRKLAGDSVWRIYTLNVEGYR